MIDRKALDDLQEIIGGDRADLIELVQEFLEDAPSQLRAMADAAAAADAEVVRRTAHTLKSNGRDLGARAFADLCAWLEADLSRGGAVADLPGRVQGIVGLWPTVERALQAEIHGNGPAS